MSEPDPLYVPAAQKAVTDKYGLTAHDGVEIRTFVPEGTMKIPSASREYGISTTAVRAVLRCPDWSEPMFKNEFEGGVSLARLPITVQCPECDRTFSESDPTVLRPREQMRTHHAKAHGESLVEVEVSCDHCGESISRDKSDVEQFERLFCGRECHGDWIRENIETARVERSGFVTGVSDDG